MSDAYKDADWQIGMTVDSKESRWRSIDTIISRGEIAEHEIFSLLSSIAQALQQVHHQGLLNLNLSVSTIHICEVSSEVLLSPGRICFSFGGNDNDPDLTPPWLKTDQSLRLNQNQGEAQKVLRDEGIKENVERIDIFQFGVLMCKIFTGAGVVNYLRSPKAKAKVPTQYQSIVDRSLGFNPNDRFQTIAEVVKCFAVVQANHDSNGESGVDDSDHETDVSGISVDGETLVSPVVSSTGERHELPWAHLAHYEIVGRIGHGGMGDVYKGFEQSLNRTVAIKVLPTDLARDADFVRRFYAEASSAARVVHPNVIPIHFIGEDQGCHFFAMQYVEGESLAGLLSTRGKLSVNDALDLIEQVLAGLGAAHQHQLIHRDIKPGNILLDSKHRRAILADFGLVKSLHGDQLNTATGVVMGTVDYISPEQGRGQAVDHRSDLYSVGVLLYQVLSGQLPFTADSPTALIFQHVYERPQSLREVVPDVPESLNAVVAKLMAKSPADRYSSTESVLEDLCAVRAETALPSQADLVLRANPNAYSRLADKSGSPGTLIISAPDFSEEPWFPEELSEAEVKPKNWWVKFRSRFGAVVQEYAPEMVDRWANTQQQVDFAVVEYERRQQRLAALVAEAEAVLEELHTQETEWRNVSQQAGDTAIRTAGELQEAIAAQSDQLDSMQLQLAKVNTTLATLQSQRNILNARLKAANGNVRAKKTREKKWKQRTLLYMSVPIFTCLGLAARGLLRNDVAHQQNRPVEVSEAKSSPSPRSGTPPKMRPWNPNLVSVEVHEKRVTTSFHGTVMVTSKYVRDKSGSGTAEMKVWNLKTGSSRIELQEPHRSIRMSMNDDETLLASIGKSLEQHQNEVKIWELASGRSVTVFPIDIPYTDSVALAFATDSSKLYFPVGRSSNHIGQIDLPSYKFSKNKLPIENSGTAIAFAPSANLLAVGRIRGSLGTRVDFHDLTTFKIRSYAPAENHVQSLAISNDGELAAGSVFGAIEVWDTKAGSQITSFSLPNRGSHHDKLIISGSKRFVAALLRGKVDVIDLKTRKRVELVTAAPCLDLAFTSDDTLITTQNESRMQFFSPETGQEQLLPMKGI